MRGSLAKGMLVVGGLLGLLGFSYSDFQPSTGLMFCAGVIAVIVAVWAVRAQPRPKEVYSPLQGGRRQVRSPYSPLWLVFPMALVAGWLFTVYAAGMTLASAVGVNHTRSGTVVYSSRHEPVRSRRSTCTLLSVVLKTERGPLRVQHCDASLGGTTITGMDVTYRTRESALGLFIDRKPGVPQLDAELEMVRIAEQETAEALQQAARAEGRR